MKAVPSLKAGLRLISRRPVDLHRRERREELLKPVGRRGCL